MAQVPPEGHPQLHRLARLVAAVRGTEMVPALLSVLDGWQGHLRVQVTQPGTLPWSGLAVARGEQSIGPGGLPRTLSVQVQGAHALVCVPVEYLDALDITE